MSTLPVTMTVDDELARLRSMLADLRTLNADMARICDERDCLRATRDCYHYALVTIAGQPASGDPRLDLHAARIVARNALDTVWKALVAATPESFIGDFDFRPGGSLTAPATPLTT